LRQQRTCRANIRETCVGLLSIVMSRAPGLVCIENFDHVITPLELR